MLCFTYQEQELNDIQLVRQYVKPKVRTRTSFVMVDAKASANPARAASMRGVNIETKAVTPTTALESRLKRTESHRFTGALSTSDTSIKLAHFTSPHPIVRV
jgi:hypothetical protein